MLKEGTIQLEASCHGFCATRARIETLGPGEVLGWSWLIPPFSWNLQARALTPGSVIVLDGARLLVECESDPKLGYRLMKRIAQLIAHRFQALREQVVEEEIHRHDKDLATA